MPGAEGRGESFSGYGVSVLRVLQVDSGDSSTTIGIHFVPLDCTLNCGSGGNLRAVYYHTSVKFKH